MVWEEAKIVRRRANRQYQTLATIVMQAVGAAQAGGRKGTRALNKFLENFDDE